MKKLLSLVLAVGVVAGVTYATNAFFSDEEKSTGNTFQAGAIDLKIDHTKQTYNDVDCKTCSVNLVSDTTNLIVAKDGVNVTPFPAVLAWVHPVWTAQNDPDLLAAGAKWIWATNPTSLDDAQNGATYTFRREFTWFGPILSSDLWFAVGSDNSVEVWLNGVKIGENLGEFGYLQGSMLHIDGNVFTSEVDQGLNVLEFKVTNFPRPGQDGFSNPGGLVYKFELDGDCEGDFFKTNCRLWGLKDLDSDDIFWKFDDLKPGDRGTNVISYHVYDNDAYMCTTLTKEDLENVIVEPEATAGDTTEPLGELSGYINVFSWNDDNGNGIYEPLTETMIGQGPLSSLNSLLEVEPSNGPVIASTTKYIGLAWCFGPQTVDSTTGAIVCTGVGSQNDSQTDIVNATLTFYAEQARNNPNFSCQNR